MNSNKNLDLARKVYPYDENLRVAYMLGLEKGYDQAMQDFLEKACEWLKHNAEGYIITSEGGNSDMDNTLLIKDFKNYMQDAKI